jgi:hypothetical protein
MSTEKVNVEFSVDHNKEKDTVVIAIKGTGFNITPIENKAFVQGLVQTIASCLYAKANDIPLENISNVLKKGGES